MWSIACPASAGASEARIRHQSASIYVGLAETITRTLSQRKALDQTPRTGRHVLGLGTSRVRSGTPRIVGIPGGGLVTVVGKR